MNLNDIRKIVSEGYLQFREDIDSFLDFVNSKNVPLVVLSATGLGEAIPMYFEKIGKMKSNIYIVTNSLNYDEEGNAISIREPIIHSLNKGEVALKGLPVVDEIKEKKNVILLGDKIADLNMTEGFEYENIIRIGFYNYEDEQDLEEYKENYDIIITGDGSFEFVNKLLEELDTV